MAHRLCIALGSHIEQSLEIQHRFLNFNEDLYRMFADNPLANVDIDEIDSLNFKIHVSEIKSSKLRRVRSMVENLLSDHNFSDDVEISGTSH